jgi:hypothetical protein
MIWHVKVCPKNREAGFGPASNRLAETFSLKWSLSSPQQPIAVTGNSNRKLKFVNAKKLAKKKQSARSCVRRVTEVESKDGKMRRLPTLVSGRFVDKDT